MSAIAEYVMPEADAQRLTNRITLIAGTVREGMEKLYSLVDEAKRGNAHVALGYPSWTEYLADTLGKTPLRLERDERREVVGYLAGEGMSTRAIAPIVGAARNTVMSDLRQVAQSEPPEPAVDLSRVDKETGEIHDQPVRQITGRDGKTYTRPELAKPRRRPLADQASDAGYELRKATERLQRITEDDRFSRNKEEVTAHLRGHLLYAVEVCQDLLDHHLHEGA